MDVRLAVVTYSLSSKAISSSQARDLYPWTLVSVIITAHHSLYMSL